MVVFRIDTFPKEGSEGFHKSLYLASFLRSKQPICFCLDDIRSIPGILKKKGYTWKRPDDIVQIDRGDVRGLVFDLNHFSSRDQELLTWASDLDIPTIQISDLGLNQQAVDYVIDGSLDYMVPYGEEKKGLFGPDHVILHHRFRHFFLIQRPYARKTTRLLLAPGSDCEYRKTKTLIDTLIRHRFQLKILASSALRRSHQKALRRIYSGIQFVGRVESLARPLFEADVALISADDRIYEAAACGTPALYFHFNKEQEFRADAFAGVGLGQKAAADWDRNPLGVVEQLSNLSREARAKMGMEAKRIVDALGIYRTVRFLCDVCGFG